MPPGCTLTWCAGSSPWLLDADAGPGGRLWFARSQLAALARVQRLRAGFALNYAAIGLVTDLLDRIAVLEAAPAAAARRTGGQQWTRTA